MSFDTNNKFINVPSPQKDYKTKDLSMYTFIKKYHDDSLVQLTDSNEDFKKDKKQALASFNKQHNICGKDHYVKQTFWRQDHTQDGPCHICPSPSWIKDNTDKLKKNRKIKEYPHRPSIDQLKHMCSPTIENWFPHQLDANPYRPDMDWKSITTITSRTTKDLYKQWFDDRRLTDDELQPLFEYHKGGKGRKGDLPPSITNLKSFKEAISSGRGSIVPCPTNSTQVTEWCGDSPCAIPTNCTNGFIGPHNINNAEYADWTHSLDSKGSKESSDTISADFSKYFKDVGPPNRQFEGCMNDIFSSTHKIDLAMTEEIKELGHWRHWKDKHIKHVKQKFEAFLINSNHEAIMNCIHKDLYLDVSICKAGLHEQLSNIIYVIMYIIGHDLQLTTINNDSDRQRLIFIIDELGDLVPRVFKKIIDISESYETQNCAGITDTTKILKELHSKVFQSGTNVVNFDLGFGKLTSEDTSETEFNRSTILAVLGIAFLKYF